MSGRDQGVPAHRGTSLDSLRAPLRKSVREDLRAHGIEPGAEETAAQLRERLNDRYLEDVRRLKARQVGGEIPLREYAQHVQALKDRYPLLGLPLSLWAE